MSTKIPERVVENLTTAVLLTDHELRLRFINPAAEMLLQLGASKVRGRRLAELLASEQRLIEVLRQALAERTIFTARGLELTLLSGHTITVDCTVSPLTDTAADTGVLVELAQVDRLLRLARDDGIQRAQLANRALIAGLAHEIKNPLGGLRGAAQLLAQELGHGSLKEYTTIIIEEADRLRALVDRMIVPNPSLARRPLNLHQILERVCNLIEAEHPGQIRIEREYDPSLPNLTADADQLTQAVLNVVRNAVEAEREALLDEAEGADALMVKPALAFLDIIRRVREVSRLPLAAYNVSGEYSAVKAAAERGWMDEPRVVREHLTAMTRAGADLLITDHARAALEGGWL